MIIINENECMACGQCEEVCEVGAIEYNDTGSGYNGCQINQDKCVQCETCLDMDCSGEAFEKVA